MVSNNLNEKDKIYLSFLNAIFNMVLDIRNSLSNDYNVNDENSEYKNYSGLCDISVYELKNKVEEYAKDNNINISFSTLHGEQRHSKIKSSLWSLQHTWCSVELEGMKLFIDPSSSQFKHLYSDIPDFYISTSPPKWFYPDCYNPIWKDGLLKKINNRIKIGIKINVAGESKKIKVGIVEYCQYELWGTISNIINKHS